jgi:hypothetical protein
LFALSSCTEKTKITGMNETVLRSAKQWRDWHRRSPKQFSNSIDSFATKMTCRVFG